MRSTFKPQPRRQAVEKKAIQADEAMKAILKELNARTLKGAFIITSAFVFDEFYNQRVTALAKYLAKEGWGVIYVAWRWSREDAMAGIGEEVYPNIFQIPVDMFLESLAELEGLTQARKYFAVEFPHPEFFVAAIKLRRYGFPIIYEILDDWEEFHTVGQSPWYIKSFEEALVLNANLISAVSQPLVDKFAGIRRDIHLSPNGFNPALLGKGSQDIARYKFQRPEIHVGYFGHLTDAWFDWDLVLRVVDLARERGVDVHFELIGYGNPDLEVRLEKYRDNVRLHGKVQPGELHKYACEWDVAMIPFKKGKLSQAVDPLKIYEYLYFGLGVIVSGIEHLKALPRVEVVGDAEEFLGALVRMREAALGGSEDKEEERVAEVLAQATWERRFSRLVGNLEAGKWMSL